MVKKEELVKRLLDSAWTCSSSLMDAGRVLDLDTEDDDEERDEWDDLCMTESRTLYETIKRLPHIADNLSVLDVYDLLHIFKNDGERFISRTKEAVSEASVKEYFSEVILKQPEDYILYFSINEARFFPEDGFDVGWGTVLRNDYMPDLKGIMLESEDKWEMVTESKTNWSIKIKTKSLGKYNAEEKCIQKFKETVNLMNLLCPLIDSGRKHTYFDNEFVQHELLLPPTTFFGKLPNGELILEVNDYDLHDLVFVREPNLDGLIFMMNQILASEKHSEIETIILNSISLFSLMGPRTPVHIKLLFCIICLEALLLYNERDQIQGKLAERIAFLLADSQLHIIIPGLLFQDLSQSFPEFEMENLALIRKELLTKMKNLYNKRSTFSHKGIGSDKRKEGITVSDYNIAYTILISVIKRLLELKVKGVTKMSKTKDSLEFYLDNLKFGHSD